MLSDRKKHIDSNLYDSLPPLEDETDEQTPDETMDELIEDSMPSYRQGYMDTGASFIPVPMLGVPAEEWQVVEVPAPEPEPVDPLLLSSSGEQLLEPLSEDNRDADWMIHIARSENSPNNWEWTATNFANTAASAGYHNNPLEPTESDARTAALQTIKTEIERNRLLRDSVRYEYFRVVDPDAT